MSTGEMFPHGPDGTCPFHVVIDMTKDQHEKFIRHALERHDDTSCGERLERGREMESAGQLVDQGLDVLALERQADPVSMVTAPTVAVHE